MSNPGLGYVIHPTNQSPPAYNHPITPSSPKAWHPKITPYRLTVLITTIGLGTAKAIVTQKGGTIVSTTLEWVAGTLLSVIFFVLSAYESQEVVPSYMSWLFEPDCMDIVWKILALIPIKRPEYVSDEVPPDSWMALSSANPDITPYRILVCSSVIAFGLSKAMLGYANQSAAATWTDWAVAVPVTTIIYILGLYEYNSSNVFPGFFAGDQSEILYLVNRGMMYSVGITLASAWAAFWMYILYQFTVDPQWDLGSLPEDRSQITLEAYFESWQAVCFKLWLQECFIAAIGIGIFVLFPLLSPAMKKVVAMSVVLRKTLRAIRRPVFIVLRPIFPSMTDDPFQTLSGIHTRWETTKSYLRIAFHLALHMSGVIFMLTFSIGSILAAIVTMYKYSWRDPAVFFVMPMWIILGLMLPMVAFMIWKSMIINIPAVHRSV